jgi:hypothetical protein
MQQNADLQRNIPSSTTLPGLSTVLLSSCPPVLGTLYHPSQPLLGQVQAICKKKENGLGCRSIGHGKRISTRCHSFLFNPGGLLILVDRGYIYSKYCTVLYVLYILFIVVDHHGYHGSSIIHHPSSLIHRHVSSGPIEVKKGKNLRYLEPSSPSVIQDSQVSIPIHPLQSTPTHSNPLIIS